MKHGLAGILMLFSTFACAAEIELLLPASGGQFAESAPGHYPVRVNLQALQLVPGDEVKLTLSGASHVVVYERSARHENGDVTWVGYLKEKGDDYRVIITRGAAGSFGRILTPDGEFALQPGDGTEVLVDRQRAGHKIMPMGDDVYIPKDMKFSPAPPDAALQNRFADADSIVDIDLMILYTPGMAKLNPGSALQTRLNFLVSYVNQNYIDSKVGINLRLVHNAQVEYSETTSNLDALNALIKGSETALSGVAALRAQYGADLVTLVRPYNESNATAGGSVGIATLVGRNGTDVSQYASQAFSVVYDGSDSSSGTYLSGNLLSHELGHNLGCAHDRARANVEVFGTGAYPYSYGHVIQEGARGTIMTYFGGVGKFSNPALSCKGQPCGISEKEPNSANNALSLNNTRFKVANFMPTSGKIPEYNFIPGYTDNGDGTVTHNPTGLTWKRCAEGLTGVTCSGTAKEYTLSQAMALGSDGWGLPTQDQLKIIVAKGNGSPTINTEYFPNTPAFCFWSASVYASDLNKPLVVCFNERDIDFDDFISRKENHHYVRLVRGGQSVPVTISALSLSCPTTLDAGASGTCSATASYTSSITKAVSPTWSSSNPTALSINSSGNLVAGSATTDTPVTISASYTENGVTKTATAIVTVKGNISTIGALSLSCPATLETGASGTCGATASYTSGTSKTVSPTWSSSNPTALTINSSGNLVAGSATTDTTVTISASYAENGVAKTATATVTVKGNTSGDFTINDDGTVLHKKTGLTWKRCIEGQTWTGTTCSGTAKDYTWDQAKALGTNGWVLPSVDQLKTIAEKGHGNPTINTTIFPNTPSSFFWSASTWVTNTDAAWIVSFYYGSNDVSMKTSGYNVRLVRTGQPAGTSSAECLFAWAEKNYPNVLAPAGAATQTLAPYTVRHYTGTMAYLGTSSTDSHLYYLGPLSHGAILDLGSAATWMDKAGCK